MTNTTELDGFVVVFMMSNGEHKCLSSVLSEGPIVYDTREEARFMALPKNTTPPSGAYAVEVWSLEDWLEIGNF